MLLILIEKRDHVKAYCRIYEDELKEDILSPRD
jgi:hypothetical protein